MPVLAIISIHDAIVLPVNEIVRLPMTQSNNKTLANPHSLMAADDDS